MASTAEIASRIKQGMQVSDNERAYLITHDPYALAAFMIENNAGSVNLTLRQMGYDHLKFVPDAKALATQLGILIENKDTQALEAITKNFVVRSNGLTTSFIEALNNQLNTVK
jgi:hypothetical protein